MKFYYIIFNFFLLLMAVVLVLLHVKHKKPNMKLQQLPSSPDHIEKSKWHELTTRPKAKNKDLAAGNLFEPQRGYIPPKPKAPEVKVLPEKEQKNIELVGILKINNYAIAFIENKNKNAEQKDYYKIGSEVHNGWTIKSIETGKVVLTDGKNGIHPLPLNRFDAKSIKRASSVKSSLSRRNRRSRAIRKTAAQKKLDLLKAKRKKRRSRFKKR